MKLFYLILIGLCLVCCSNLKTQDTPTADSTLTDSVSTGDVVSEITAEEVVADVFDEPEGDSLQVVIENAFNELSGRIEGEENPYTITSDYNGYEAGSRSTWFFDSSLNLRYCKGSWDMEGTSGSYSYYFESDDLVAHSNDEGNDYTVLHTGFQPIYGFVRTSIEDGAPEEIRYLGESSYTETNSTAKAELSKLINFIQNNLDSATVTDREISIHIESVENYGMEVTISQDYSISKILYDKLSKE